MKKFLLLIMCLYAGASAYAQMATTTEAGNDGVERLISNDQRKIHFGSVAKKLYADLNPETHKKEGYYFGTEVYYNNFTGYSDENNDYQAPTCTYSYSNGVGTFSYRNNRNGTAMLNSTAQASRRLPVSSAMPLSSLPSMTMASAPAIPHRTLTARSSKPS